MSIKLIAVDMDGTFLNGEKKYNKQRFLAQFLQLQARNIHFVAASGNQLWTLKNYFSEIQDEIAYVAENGAYVMDGVEEVSFSHFSQNVVNTMVDDLLQRYADGVILCGKQGAYIGPEVKPEAMPKLNKYFKRLQQVDDLKKVDDLICKVTINTTYYDFETLTNDLKTKSYIQSGDVKMVSSGFGFIDLIVPHKHKAYGLDFLQKKWQVQDHEILAIGDNNNDIEMVKKAGYGFAVENAIPELKQVAKYQAKHNEQEAVLDVIDIVLNATSEEELARLCQAESL